MRTGSSDAEKRSGRARAWFMLALSGVIIATVLVVVSVYAPELYNVDKGGAVVLVPFATCLAGVLLFILSVSRRRRETWDLKKYAGEHCYRIAQAFAYLFIVLWAWTHVRAGTQMTDVPPNILGFLVGFFILRVERAMDSLGEKLEEVLMSILPQSVTYMTVQEQRRRILRDTYRLEDVTAKYEVLRPMIEDSAARHKIDEKLTNTLKLASAEEPEKTSESINDLARSVEDARQALGEGLVPLDELPGPGSGQRPAKT